MDSLSKSNEVADDRGFHIYRTCILPTWLLRASSVMDAFADLSANVAHTAGSHWACRWYHALCSVLCWYHAKATPDFLVANQFWLFSSRRTRSLKINNLRDIHVDCRFRSFLSPEKPDTKIYHPESFLPGECTLTTVFQYHCSIML